MTKRVLIVGAHNTSSRSMHRYTSLLVQAWSETGASVDLTSPPDLLSRRTRSPTAKKWLSYIEKFTAYSILLLIKSRGKDIVHIADHSDAIWVLSLSHNSSVFVTCHDLIAVKAALGLIPSVRIGASGRLYQALVRRGLSRADRIYSVSMTTAEDVQRIIQKTSVLLVNPVDPSIRPQRNNGDAVTSQGRYLLNVGSNSWRKRRHLALEVWERLINTDFLHDLDLVLVGPPLDQTEASQLPPHLLERVHSKVAVSDEELATLYRRSVALVMTSSDEGFGWPIVEAHSAGRPAIATDIPILREVGGEGCIYLLTESGELDPRINWHELGQKLVSDDLRLGAQSNAQRFTYDHFVKQLS